jgi:hypothetical protein
MEIITVRYHSQRWEMLVASGWATMFVDRKGRAHMMRRAALE